MSGQARPRKDDDIEGMFRGLERKYGLEKHAQPMWVGRGLGLRYREPFHHPWPRSVMLHVDVLGRSLADIADVAANVLSSPQEPHLASVFGMDAAEAASRPGASGYDVCWTTSLLARTLKDEAPLGASEFKVERVMRPAQVDEVNALGPGFPTSPLALGDPALIDILLRNGAGHVVAKGQVVVGLSDTAYIADMFTFPDARRRGCGREVLAALGQIALKAGARRAALTPSRMAAETGFYEACGYDSVCPVAVLLSKEPPAR